MRRILIALPAALVLALLVAITPVAATSQPLGQLGKKHIFKTVAQFAGVSISPTNLYSSGGPVQTNAKVYLSYWGPQWASGFGTGGYTSAQAQTYIQDFFANVGGSGWNTVDTQYCQGVPNLTFDCNGNAGAQYITNPAGQLAGTWNDPTPVPATPADADIAAAALRAQQHFGYSPQANYIVLTPTGHNETGFNTVWCAWHNVQSTPQGETYYTNLPWQPDAGANCGQNFVNSTNDSFGHGYFDGFSIVGGHEYAETNTDPGAGSGWADLTGQENGDKCAWNAASSDRPFGSFSFAVQPIWSNAIQGCSLGR
jgi:hypothetical protein